MARMFAHIWRQWGAIFRKQKVFLALLAVALTYVMFELNINRTYTIKVFAGDDPPNDKDRCEATVSSAVHLLFSQIAAPPGINTSHYLMTLKQAPTSCLLYDEVAARNRTYAHNVLGRPSLEHDDITLVTQMSTNKMDRFLLALKNWKGPLSVSVYVSSDHINSAASVLCVAPVRDRVNLQLHLMIQQEPGPLYPVNFLRGVAMEAAYTKYVFLDDVDMVPGPHVYTNLLNSARHLVGKQLLVVPAFEIDAIPQDFPETKAEVIDLWKSGVVRSFHKKSFDYGHRPSKYEVWKTAEKPYLVEWAEYYEPYIAAEKAILPPYPTQFVSRYFDKAAHIAHAAAMGFEMRVMPRDFVLHLHHASVSFPDVQRCANRLFNKFKFYLNSTYANFHKFKVRVVDIKKPKGRAMLYFKPKSKLIKH